MLRLKIKVKAVCGVEDDKSKESADTVRLAMAHSLVYVDVIAGRNRGNR